MELLVHKRTSPWHTRYHTHRGNNSLDVTIGGVVFEEGGDRGVILWTLILCSCKHHKFVPAGFIEKQNNPLPSIFLDFYKL